jgi:hypothetical protein
MRILLGLVAVLCVTVASAGASAAVPPGSSYAWVQPGTAIVSTPFAQPPAWIFTDAAAPSPATPPGYAWVQPETAVAFTPFAQPPNWIPTG